MVETKHTPLETRDPQPETKEAQGWFSRLKSGLKRSSEKLTQGITAIVRKRKLDDQVLEELEDLLITADLGVPVAARLTQTLRQERFDQDISEDELKKNLADEITKILDPLAVPLTIEKKHAPHVILVVGVNGSGKTTTLGKLGKYWQDQGLRVSFAAADTFRAAAIEQLEIWAHRLQVPLYKAPQGSDPASLAFDAFHQAKSRQDDVLLIDTAGRLHNKENLMAELAKIRRVLQKIDPTAPHSCLLVLDTTIGQNAYAQTELFQKTAQISGMILTKLDGTARGGVLVGLAETFQLPIHAIGVGEQAEDLRPFQAAAFAKGLVGLD